jgi:hypothetical protein
MKRNRASARPAKKSTRPPGAGRAPRKKASARSERRIRVSTLPADLRRVLVLDLDIELRKAHRDKAIPPKLREGIVKVVRRFVQQHGLASVGYRFESSLSLDADPVDIVMLIARNAYDMEGSLVYTDDLADRIADELADQQAL